MTCVSNGAGTAYFSGGHEFDPFFSEVNFRVVFCRPFPFKILFGFFWGTNIIYNHCDKSSHLDYNLQLITK